VLQDLLQNRGHGWVNQEQQGHEQADFKLA
jgi:hypothetical protein